MRDYIENQFQTSGYSKELTAYRIIRTFHHVIDNISVIKFTGHLEDKNLPYGLRGIIKSYIDGSIDRLLLENSISGMQDVYTRLLEEEYDIKPFSFIDREIDYGIEHSGVEDLIDLILWIDGISKEGCLEFEHIDLFFDEAITPFYSPLFTGLDINVGHFIYRLSERIPEKIRRLIALYPSPHGTIYIEDYDSPLDSLEDWRKEWKNYFVVIPEIHEALPENAMNLVKGISGRVLEHKEK